MSDAKALVAAALQRVAAAVERMKDEELAKLADPSFDLEIRVVRRRSKEDSETVPTDELQLTVETLTAFPSRAEALDYLTRTFETKKPLEQIARFLDIPILKQDKAEALRDKIIEATTGARIRSQAIQGH